MSHSRSRSGSITSHKFDLENGHPINELLAALELRSPEIVAPRDSWWWKYKEMLREPMAKFTGTMLFVIFGIGVDCSVVLSQDPAITSFARGDWLSIRMGWAIGYTGHGNLTQIPLEE
ncbi:hypothetical protein H0H81_006106, partial [Sphagnurus paluster]